MSVDIPDDVNMVQPLGYNTASVAVSIDFTRLGMPDKSQLANAALRAKRCLPGIIGETIADEITTWNNLGFRLDGLGHCARLVAAVMALPEPGSAPHLKSPALDA